MKIEAPATITVAGKEYPVSGFSETVQKLVAIHTEWRNDLQEEQLAVAKTQAAIRALDAELTATVQAELNPKPAPAPVPPAANDAPATDAPAPATDAPAAS
jgi:hypothetical protein